MMNNTETHQMVVTDTLPDGSQVWHCPTCGRRFVMHWPPNYHREILEEGDNDAIHTGGTEGLVMGSPSIQADAPEQEEVPVPFVPPDDRGLESSCVDLNDPTLAPWRRWVEDYGQ